MATEGLGLYVTHRPTISYADTTASIVRVTSAPCSCPVCFLIERVVSQNTTGPDIGQDRILWSRQDLRL